MSGVNKVILIGHCGNDPDVKELDNGLVANVSLATSESWKDRNGDKQERTEWHKLSFFGRLAEIVEQYVKKGDKIYVEGKLQTRSWEQDGVKRYSTEIVANNMQMLGTPAESPSGPSREHTAREGRSSGDGGRRRGGAPPTNSRSRNAPAHDADSFDDDIPF